MRLIAARYPLDGINVLIELTLMNANFRLPWNRKEKFFGFNLFSARDKNKRFKRCFSNGNVPRTIS